MGVTGVTFELSALKVIRVKAATQPLCIDAKGGHQ